MRTASLDAPTGGDVDRPLRDTLASDVSTPEDSVERQESRTKVRDALVRAFEELDDQRAAVVIRKRLLSDDPATLAEIGKELDLSREGARLLELRLIKRMKQAFADQAA